MKRGRNQRRRQGVNVNRALDSNGPDVRIRGTANQIYDKYQTLARDATSAGDRVKAESYLQHAEHYFRLIKSMQPANTPNQTAAPGDQPDVDEREDSNESDGDSSREEQNSRPNGRQRDQNRDNRRRRQDTDKSPSETVKDGASQDQPEAAQAESEDDQPASDASNIDEKPAAKKPVRRPRKKRAPASEPAEAS